MYGLVVPEVPFALCLNHVFGYVHSDFSIDRPCSTLVKSCRVFHNPDFHHRTLFFLLNGDMELHRNRHLFV